ncbi:MAG: alpha/beta fold hydrolase, partial [Pseudomonadota bacterium]
MTLASATYGEGPPLLIAHGLYGSARNWGVIAKRLSDRHAVTAVDMRNHGDSPWFDTHSYDDMAGDLAPFAGGDVLGHSMGGKAAMVLALTQPNRVTRLVVADIAPVTYGHSQQIYIDAMRKVDLTRIEMRSDADAQLAEYVDDPGIRAFLLQSL